MSYVIKQDCLGERYATCVDVCPVNCIYPGEYKNEVFMVIDPEICIDCGACLPECPVEAIVATEDEAPEWAKVNEELSPMFKDNPPVDPRPVNEPRRKQQG